MSRDALYSILKGALIAAAGAVTPYLLDAIQLVPFGQFSPVVGAIASVVVNAVRKYLTDNPAPAPGGPAKG